MSAVRLAARAAVVSALGFTLVPVLGANPAYACSCIQSTEQDNFERADVVFKGTLDDVDGAAYGPNGRVFVFTPSATYKGTTTKPQKVSSAGDSAMCGVELTGSGPFLVFAYKAEDAAKAPLSTNLCAGTREIKAGEEPDFKVNTTGKADEGPTEPATPRAMTDAEKERLEAGSGGGSDPMPADVDPEAPDAPKAGPAVTEPEGRDVPISAPVPTDGDVVDAPLMQQTGAVANDSSGSGESVNAADDSGNTGWAVAGVGAALVAMAAVGTGWAVRRRRSI